MVEWKEIAEPLRRMPSATIRKVLDLETFAMDEILANG